MSTETNKAVVMRWQKMWYPQTDLGDLEEFIAADFVSHSMPPGISSDIAGIRQWVGIFHKAFPDAEGGVDQVVAEGDKVAVRFIGTGTHQGDLFGIPPTGKPIRTTGINIFRLEAGKIVEHWNNADDLGVLQQLGVIPS
ncbi:MAG TPA: ester cyclase [Anaerolineae bacterium]|nr:ester cyclase [Anaerolineae bacterium]